jgi:hypothetical protein
LKKNIFKITLFSMFEIAAYYNLFLFLFYSVFYAKILDNAEKMMWLYSLVNVMMLIAAVMSPVLFIVFLIYIPLNWRKSDNNRRIRLIAAFAGNAAAACFTLGALYVAFFLGSGLH